MGLGENIRKFVDSNFSRRESPMPGRSPQERLADIVDRPEVAKAIDALKQAAQAEYVRRTGIQRSFSERIRVKTREYFQSTGIDLGLPEPTRTAQENAARIFVRDNVLQPFLFESNAEENAGADFVELVYTMMNTALNDIERQYPPEVPAPRFKSPAQEAIAIATEVPVLERQFRSDQGVDLDHVRQLSDKLKESALDEHGMEQKYITDLRTLQQIVEARISSAETASAA